MYFLAVDSSSGMGSLGRLSWWAKVMPGFDVGFVCDASGALSSAGKDSSTFLGPSVEAGSPLEVAILKLATARVSFSELGTVNVRTAMVKSGGQLARRIEER